ncbi:hypothetical protein BDV29DRAFT_14007 [Aspergillus leporis]|uniref:Uncharacterized protein n=1 Tax=Aspergillus leporis TaxID=41062 RepID=A0A5N5WT36_9EURO|nr:hypothetical protein BDV29DRAFT_14007 [Aspergillus leporis]
MPPFSTPFRVPPSSARPSTGHQFASTPRFILSQQTPGSATQAQDDEDSIDAESPQSTPVATTRIATREQGTKSTHRQKEVIKDSDDDLSNSEVTHRVSPEYTTGDAEPNSSPSGDTRELEAEFEALFGPTTSRQKRRASFATETPLPQRRKRDDDLVIQTSSPEAPSPTKDRGPPPNHTRRETIPQRTVSATTTPTPRHSKPGSIKPSFRNHPRFVISTSQALSSSQPQSTARPPPPSTTPAPTSPPSRRKPTFVLPRSPSPGEDPSALPTPFSPSSHTLRRRGRARSSAPSYIPGGMAAEVRSWILEMGTKREQMQMSRAGTGTAIPDLQKYFLVVRITNAHQSAIGSSGPLAFIQGQHVTSLGDDDEGHASAQRRNVLLLGSPRSRPAGSSSQYPTGSYTPELLPGNLVGVYRGLVWELNLTDTAFQGALQNIASDHDGILSCGEQTEPITKWLVGMEWEVISS